MLEFIVSLPLVILYQYTGAIYQYFYENLQTKQISLQI